MTIEQMWLMARKNPLVGEEYQDADYKIFHALAKAKNAPEEEAISEEIYRFLRTHDLCGSLLDDGAKN